VTGVRLLAPPTVSLGLARFWDAFYFFGRSLGEKWDEF
jgi:hypothetical protein